MVASWVGVMANSSCATLVATGSAADSHGQALAPDGDSAAAFVVLARPPVVAETRAIAVMAATRATASSVPRAFTL